MQSTQITRCTCHWGTTASTMYNETAAEHLVAFFQRLLNQLQPIAICLLHFAQANHSDYASTGQLYNALLQVASQQHGPISLLVLTQLPRQETQNFPPLRIPQVLGQLRDRQLLCVHLLHSQWDVEFHNDFMKQYLNSRMYRANDVYPRHRHLLLLPAEPLHESVGSLINSELPCAILAGYQPDETAGICIVSVGYVEDFNRSSDSWTAADVAVPQLGQSQRRCGMAEMRLCDGCVHYVPDLRAIDEAHSAEIQLLPFLAHHWHCPVRSALWQFPEDEWCTMVNLLLLIKPPKEVRVAWMWRRYVLIMPNWWHWQRPDGGDSQSRPVIAIAGSLVCWLALLIGRHLATAAGHAAASSLLGMWARLLAVTDPAAQAVGARSWLTHAVLMLASALGMWNSMVLCGALFELQLGGREWQPVFRRAEDVWAHEAQVRVLSDDRTVYRYIVERNWRKDGSNFMEEVSYWGDELLRSGGVCLVEDGTEMDLVGWWRAYEENGTHMYRKVYDDRLLVPLSIHISPAYLTDEIREAELWFREIGIQQRMFERQEQWKRWSMDAPIRNGSVVFKEAVPALEVNEEFVFVVQFFCGLMAVTVITWIGEMLVAEFRVIRARKLMGNVNV